jgi:hypothetical protein
MIVVNAGGFFVEHARSLRPDAPCGAKVQPRNPEAPRRAPRSVINACSVLRRDEIRHGFRSFRSNLKMLAKEFSDFTAGAEMQFTLRW